MSATPGIPSILDHLDRATASQIREGTVWYKTAHAFTRGVAYRYGLPGGASQAAAALAALSPQQTWGSNQRALVLLCETGSTYGLGANIGKARRILSGESAESVFTPPNPQRITGDKVRAFYECIRTAGRTTAVCIDRHAADIALGRPTTAPPLPSGFLTHKRYLSISDAYVEAAARTDFSPCQLQAITWLVRRSDKLPHDPARHDR